MFPVVELPESPETDPEQMGTKPKFWFRHNKQGLLLWKEARQNTGEDWSEKIAAQLADRLGLPHAHYDLATYRGHYGVVTRSLVKVVTDPNGRITPTEQMIHGNELLYALIDDYPVPGDDADKFRNSAHTLERILHCFREFQPELPHDFTPSENIKTAEELFVGYLLLDAWIGNGDRHHGNWAFIDRENDGILHRALAPTYDHASCLGRELTDRERHERLTTTDRGHSVAAYAQKARSAIYGNIVDTKPLRTLDAFVQIADLYPAAARTWLGRLEAIDDNDIMAEFARIPMPARITETAAEFARSLLRENRVRLLATAERL